MLSALYTLYAVDLGSSLIDGIISQDVDDGLTELMSRSDGKVDPEFAGVVSCRPRVRFTTRKIGQALGICGIGGDDGALTMFFQKFLNKGTRAGTLAHLKGVAASCLTVPRTIEASQDGEATMSLEAFPISTDGSTNPLAWTASQTLAGSPDDDEKYTVGPCLLNNAAPTGVSRISVDFGISVIESAGDGDTFRTFAAIESRMPEFVITTRNLDLLATYGGDGVVISAATAVSFRPFTNGSVAGAADITLTANEGFIHARAATAPETGEATVEIRIKPTYDGSNAILVQS